jgi:hypothetical protein
MNYYKSKWTNKELCLKVENVIAFMKSFMQDKHKMKCISIYQHYEIYYINKDFSMHVHENNQEMYLVSTNELEIQKDQYMFCLENTHERVSAPPTFYNDDYYTDFIYINHKRADEVDIEVDGEGQTVSTLQHNLLNEDEEFQFSTVYSDTILNVVQFVQYFKEYDTSFRVWFSPKIEELYEVLDEKYGIRNYHLS